MALDDVLALITGHEKHCPWPQDMLQNHSGVVEIPQGETIHYIRSTTQYDLHHNFCGTSYTQSRIFFNKNEGRRKGERER